MGAAGTSTITETATTAMAAADGLLDAVAGGRWPIAVGFGLTILVFLFKRFGVLDKVKLGSKWGIRFGTLALAVLASVGAGLSGGMAWTEILMNAAEVAVAAVGGWEFIGKLLRDVGGGKAPAPPDEGGGGGD